MKRLVVSALLASASLTAAAQDLALTNAHIVVGNGSVIERGSIVIRGGRIALVASGTAAPTASPRSICAA